MVRKPFVAHQCVFGCLAYALVLEQHRRKLDDKAMKCIFVGYNSKSSRVRGCIICKLRKS